MAKYHVSPQQQFSKSPFGVLLKTRVRRGKMIAPPRNTKENKRVYDLMVVHLMALCREKGCGVRVEPHLVSAFVFGQPLKPSRAWEALIRSFEDRHADLVASEEPIRLSIAFARGRLFSMAAEERVSIVREMASNSAEQRSQLYAAERAANGGELDFFTSGTWKRLRFEVLAESAGCCDLCGRSYRVHGVALEVDHIKPRSRFPNLALDKDNLQVLCFDCNRGKGNRDDTDWREGPQEDAA